MGHSRVSHVYSYFTPLCALSPFQEVQEKFRFRLGVTVTIRVWVWFRLMIKGVLILSWGQV